VRRYDVGIRDHCGFFCNGYGKENEHGDWVLYEDVIDLERQLAEARAALNDLHMVLTRKGYAWMEKHAAALKAAKELEKALERMKP